jgi:hypothetical protein
MKPVDKIARAISQFEVQAPARLDERVREHVREAFANSIPAPAAQVRTRRWRLLVGSQVAQLAAAAVIMVTLLLGPHLWNLLGTEVYAVEQTVEALRKIETAHAFCTDWQGRKFEMWIRPDPATGANDFICVAEAERDCVMISTPRVSYDYYPGRNLVRIIRGQLITSDLNLAKMIESLTQEADKKGDSVEIGRKVTDRYGDAITIHRAGPAWEYQAWIDPETKLLLGLEYTRCSNPGEMTKSLDEIRYNEPVPEQWLYFQCPDNAMIKPEKWGDLDDPNCGIDVTALSDEEACREILTRLFDAINAANLGQMRQLVPVAKQWDDEQLVTAIREGINKLWDDQTPGVAAYEIGAPYQDKACPLGVLVPCALTDHNDQRFVIDLIVRFRQTEGRRTCVVVYTWGGIKPRLGAMHQRRPWSVPDSPFEGPIDAAGAASLSTLLIVPTNEADKATEQQIHDYVRTVQKFIMGKFPDREVKILTDTDALQADLSQSSVSVYGTPQGNLWLAKHIAALPVVIEPNSITADRMYEGSDLRFISTWPHPQNPRMGVVIYTAQRAEDVIAINSIFHGPTDYLVAQGRSVVHAANYVKKKGQWTFQ